MDEGIGHHSFIRRTGHNDSRVKDSSSDLITLYVFIHLQICIYTLLSEVSSFNYCNHYHVDYFFTERMKLCDQMLLFVVICISAVQGKFYFCIKYHDL